MHIHVFILHTHNSQCSPSDLSGHFLFVFQDGEITDFCHDDALYDAFPVDSMSQREMGEDVSSHTREYNLR